MQAITINELQTVFSKHPAPFSYDLNLHIFPSKQIKADVTICCHGYGHNFEIGAIIHSFGIMSDHILSFNFPDHDCLEREIPASQTTFGSIEELLPLLYVIKTCVLDAGLPTINLYGFSAGGATVINALAVLNQTKYDEQLKKIGIDPEVKKKIVAALENGLIILDCPLKSVEEILDLRGDDPEMKVLAERYKKNDMRPLDTVSLLKGLRLQILLYFEMNDEIIGNRDDLFFIDRLKAANKGLTDVIFGSEGGHNTYHRLLWNEYKNLQNKQL